MEWEEEFIKRENFFGRVCEQFFEVDDVLENVIVDEEGIVVRFGNQVVVVGMVLFEIQQLYFQFLDMFFMIIVFKIMLIQYSKVFYFVLLFFLYSKYFLVLDIKFLVVFQQRFYSDILVKFIKSFFSFFRSQSFIDVCFVSFKLEVFFFSLGFGVEIK